MVAMVIATIQSHKAPRCKNKKIKDFLKDSELEKS